MKNYFLISLPYVVVFFHPYAFADTPKDAVNKLSADMQNLKNDKTLRPEEKAAKANSIFQNLENSSEGEDKLLVATVKEESNKFINKGLAYNKFLEKVSDPSFFNLKNAQDPVNLDQQILTAKEYQKNSVEIRDYAKNLPEQIRASLKSKNISEDKINSTLKGIKDSEAQAAKTPAMIFQKRVEHADVLLKGLEYLKKWQGKWKYDDKADGIRIKEKSDLEAWNREILIPINTIEKELQ